MKIYSVMVVNELTGNIDHCITSDYPISDKMVPVETVTGSLKTIPSSKTTYKNIYCEFYSDSFCRGGDAIKKIAASKGKLSCKDSSISNLKITTEHDMRANHKK